MENNNYGDEVAVGVCCYFCSFDDSGEEIGICYVGLVMPLSLSGEGWA